MAEAQGSAYGGRGLIRPNDDMDGSGMEVIGSVNGLDDNLPPFVG